MEFLCYGTYYEGKKTIARAECSFNFGVLCLVIALFFGGMPPNTWLVYQFKKTFILVITKHFSGFNNIMPAINFEFPFLEFFFYERIGEKMFNLFKNIGLFSHPFSCGDIISVRNDFKDFLFAV